MRFSLAAWLVVDALAVYRLTRLVVNDRITGKLRESIGGVRRIRDRAPIIYRPRAWYFVTCPWCTSVWIGAVAVVLTWGAPDPWSYVAAALAFSAVAGVLSEVVPGA